MQPLQCKMTSPDSNCACCILWSVLCRTVLSKGYSSPTLSSLLHHSTTTGHINVSSLQGSWIASLSILGALLGGVLSSIVLRYGRKNSLLLVSIPFYASWMFTVFTSNVEMISCTAFLAGLYSAIVGLVR